MRYSFDLAIPALILIAVLTSCVHTENKKNIKTETINKQLYNPTEINKIRQSFADWQKLELKAGNYNDSCNPAWFARHEVKETLDSLMFGFPTDSSEYKFSFADLNNDGKLDGLVTFTPNQCDGGNAAMWLQIEVFLLSDKDIYKVVDSIQVDKFDSTEFDSLGFYWLDSIGVNKIYGTYIEFKDTDGRCCPSINRPVTFDFENRKLINLGKNIPQQ